MLFISGLAFILAAAATPGEAAAPAAPAVTIAFGRGVVNRTLTEADDSFTTGDKVIAFTSVAGVGHGFVEHVWYRDGQEVARHYLPVGGAHRFRTWSRHQVKPGAYEVQVLGPDGKLLATGAFVVRMPEPDAGC